VSQRGFTLLEALIAVSLLGIVLAGVVPTFLTYLDVNTLTEERSAAIAVAQQAVEELRQADPTAMPTTGTSPVQVISVGQRDFEVVTRFCTAPAFCTSDSRHLVVEVRFGGRTVYSIETIFTALR
jgi:prepilin-type N-terminal cleavage/methylation domain-containing protein